jgi:hypothetical protein
MEEFIIDWKRAMNRNLNESSILGGFVAVAVLAAVCAVAQPTVAKTATLSAKPMSATCTVEISIADFSPLVVSNGTGGNVLFSGSTSTEAQCDRMAITQYKQALATGWSAANRCTIAANAGHPSDELLVEITYIWNGNPSVREDGYAVMCQPTLDVTGVPAY